ncbi:hypothetical protein UF75_1558 [Desulfosporosinus sp. I2]|uniref:hypothetical protein n=1 Tax=Desulfosporosinus sp. I2 TaxID=1617025 RepID=UPI0005EDFD30|nr:hypothetical protein [Desulfosporosinus sp. I2]KJR48085.1 hypothetical protein UF75_1558 [Desulfosporosinus sp. I2]
MPFEEDLRKKDFLITAELLPPRGTEVTELLKQAEELKPYVDAFILQTEAVFDPDSFKYFMGGV